ncbi:MAG: potassium channel family protein [Muribaculaceae bacterium]|nr:potassium channel family protein [Muribaculaceae bacterium]
MNLVSRLNNIFNKEKIYFILHVIVLVLSIYLIWTISCDTFNGISAFQRPRFMKIEFWICVVFIFDFFIELILSERKWHYFLTHILFLIVSVPYGALIEHYGWNFGPETGYLVRYIPLIRSGYALAIVVGWFTYNKATGLFVTYVVTMVATVYFSSLVFFVFEHGVNSAVVDYNDSLWWACMDVTTIGCNIEAVTPVGKVLSVLLALIGLMLFPVFTVYVTSLINQTRNNNQINTVVGKNLGGGSDSDSAGSQVK